MRAPLSIVVLISALGSVACAEDPAFSEVATTPLEVGGEAFDEVSGPADAPADFLAQATGARTCSGKAGKHRGKTKHTLQVANVQRSFVYYAPPNLDPNKPAPIVIVPHGFTMHGEMMYNITQYHQLADREGFVVFYPDGALGVGPWNVGPGLVCGLGAFVPGINADQALVDAMVKFA